MALYSCSLLRALRVFDCTLAAAARNSELLDQPRSSAVLRIMSAANVNERTALLAGNADLEWGVLAHVVQQKRVDGGQLIALALLHVQVRLMDLLDRRMRERGKRPRFGGLGR